VKRQVPIAAVVAIAVLIVGAVGYWMLIRPKQAKASSLDTQIASLQTQLDSASHAEPPPENIKVADLLGLAKAMPDQQDMSGILLELNTLASESGVSFVSVTPQSPTSAGTYQVVPITVDFDGSYYDLVAFLFRLRNLVTVKNGTLNADGRLLNLSGLKLSAGAGGFPQVLAELTLDAYVYGSQPLGSTAPSTSTDTTSTDTTATSTAPTDTTQTDTTSSSDAVPSDAGATP
jgi:type IV pilus assembly protein PilO